MASGLAEAKKWCDEARRIVKTRRVSGQDQPRKELPTPTPTPTSSKGVSSEGDPALQFRAKLATWTPTIKTAMQARGPEAAAMAKLYTEATALSKSGGDMAQALARLTECHQMARATHLSLSEAAKDRLKAVLALAREAGATEAAANAKQLCADADLATSTRDWPRVFALMTQAEEMLGGGMASSSSSSTDSSKATAGDEQDDSDDDQFATTTAATAADSSLTLEEPVWEQARDAALAVLRQVAREIAALRAPDSAAAVKQITVLVEQLEEDPVGSDDVARLRRLIESDEVLLDVSEMSRDIRGPLLKALAALS